MGKIVVLILIVSSLFLREASPQTFEYEIERIKREKKPAIVYFYSKFCFYCEIMEKNVILSDDVKRAMESKVVLIWVDGDSRKDLMKTYGVFGFPTIVLLDPKGESLGQVPGYIHKERFLKIISYLANGHYKKVPLSRFLERKV